MPACCFVAERESPMYAWKRIQWIACLLAWAASTLFASAGQPCIVCGGEPKDAAATVNYRGREYPVHAQPCFDEWRRAQDAGTLDTIVHRIEPRGALFQGDAKFLNPEFQAARPMHAYYLWCGVWILVAILSGGIAAAMAVSQKGNTGAVDVQALRRRLREEGGYLP